MTEEPISAKAAAREFGTTARTLRKFLRSEDCPFDAVGQGRRYEFTPKQVRKLHRLFDEWNNGKNTTIEVEEPELDESIKELELDEEEG